MRRQPLRPNLLALLLAVLLTAVAATAATAAADPEPPPRLLLDGVALTGDAVVFAHAGDLWTVPRSGGTARRLTTGPGEDDAPAVSPDDRLLAFSREQGGNQDVYLLSLDQPGAEPRRLTWHPADDRVCGFTPDGRVLLRSDRLGFQAVTLFTLAPDGVLPRPLDLPRAFDGALSPDGRRVAYLPWSWFYERMPWSHYRGGLTSPLWIADLESGRVEVLGDDTFNHRHPRWLDDRLYYAADPDGVFNLYVHHLGGGRDEQLTSFADHGVEGLAVHPDGDVVFVRDGALWLLAAGGTPRRLTVRVPADRSELAPRTVAAERFIEDAEPLPDGSGLLLGARGETLLWRPGSAGDAAVARNLTATPGIGERHPVPSPDGRRAAVVSDAGGEEHLEIRSLDDGRVLQTLAVEDAPSFYRQLDWSPDGRRLVFTDARLRLWLADLATGTARVVDRSTYVAQGSWQTDWSPDGAWLAYSKALPVTRLRALFLHHPGSGRTVQVTDGTSHCEHPTFDAGGRWLWFVSSSDARLAAASDVDWGLLSSDRARPLVTRRVHLAVLAADGPSPLLDPPGQPAPGVDPRAVQEVVRVDPDGLQRRIVPVVGAGTRDVLDLQAGPPGVVFARVAEWPATPGDAERVPTPVLRLDLAAGGEPVELVEDADGFRPTAAGSRLLWQAGGRWFLGDATPAQGGDGATAEPEPLDLSALTVDVDPAAEWRQMYHQAWRQLREYFYDPGFHGRDLEALEAHYATYLPTVTRRADLNRLFAVMLGEISVSHLQVGGGDLPESPDGPPPVGVLGADLEADPATGRWRLARIHRAAHFTHVHPLLRAPLDTPGLPVEDGDLLLAVDGEELTTADNPYRALAGKARRPVELTVASAADGADRRTFTTVALPTDGVLRMHTWGEERRRMVDELSGGRLAYVWVRGYSGTPLEDLTRALLGTGDKEGLVIDQRFNGGGTTSDALIEAFTRRRLYAYAYRHGEPFPVPPVAYPAPKVLITSRYNFSAAETFALMFDLAGAGPIVGARTAGGGIGAALWQPALVDGGEIRIPNRAAFDPAGVWRIENRGVVPDVEVPEIDPADGLAAARDGRDPQLEAAVREALTAVERPTPETVTVPPYPRYP